MRVLIIEDDRDVLDNILHEVENEFIVDVAYNGCDGAYYAQVNDYDAIVVDTVLEDMPGPEVCKVTREANVTTPILVLSESTSTAMSARLASLNAGADAYVNKPVDPVELCAQIRALVRRRQGTVDPNTLKWKGLYFDFKKRTVAYESEKVFLRRKEFDLLEYLILHKGTYVSREQILEHAWKLGMYVFSNTVEVHIKSLRDKFKKYYGPDFIKTRRGFGYIIEA